MVAKSPAARTSHPARPAAPVGAPASAGRARLSHVPRGPGPREVLGAVPDLDRLIHERLRLGIVSALAVNETLSFSDLKHLLRTTDGNLSVHARKLEEAGYIACTKYFEGRLPKTDYRLTPAGGQALEAYLRYMEDLIRATRGQ